MPGLARSTHLYNDTERSTVKLLLFQAEHFAWRSHSKTLPDVPDQTCDERVEHALVVFLHAEAQDPENPKLETKIVKNIKWLANKRQFTHVVLHSFTHLSESTAPADYAQDLLNQLQQRLEKTGYQVHQTPFGYFSAWDISVYGESLAKVFKSL